MAHMQGWRPEMEDTYISHPIDLPKDGEKGMLFGVFDGHGGDLASKFAMSHFKDILIE